MGEQLIADMGKYVISEKPDILACLALGSCVGVGLFDPERFIGTMGHVMLPSSEGSNLENCQNPNKYADIQIPNMLKELKEKGCDPSRLVAKVAGGAHMFKSLNTDIADIGQKNGEAVKKILLENGITIKSEKLGGGVGRTVRLYLENGEYEIKTKEGIEKI
jgi:chemotaxis protein CheD